MAIFSNKKETEELLYTANNNRSSIVIDTPYITEKTTFLAEQGKYVFIVEAKANKIEIKKAIKDIYKVDVTKVNKIKVNPKKKGWGKNAGTKSGFVKAIVTIKEGQKIEILK